MLWALVVECALRATQRIALPVSHGQLSLLHVTITCPRPGFRILQAQQKVLKVIVPHTVFAENPVLLANAIDMQLLFGTQSYKAPCLECAPAKTLSDVTSLCHSSSMFIERQYCGKIINIILGFRSWFQIIRSFRSST